ncbi:MAG: hypothetical protein H0W72_09850 [Planctomycetes bacterium]|nr:hypothetical protein [Planctomycetota bacterium]
MITLFAIASAITFGVYLWRHSEDAALMEHYVRLRLERQALQNRVPELEKVPPEADRQIVDKRAKIQAMADAEAQIIQDVDRLKGDAGVKVAALTKALQDEGQRYQQLLADASARRNELKQEEERALALDRDFDERRLKSREQIELLSRELEGLKREARKANTERERRIAELNARIQQLTQQRELNSRELRADGQVLSSRATDGYLVVDRGQQQNLRKGTRFTIFNRRGGRKVVKGAIEIVEVEARMSIARVTEERDANDPIVPGDYIHNPVYSPDQVKTFVIKGDFFRYSAEELARFIKESGAKVEPELTTNTDYLVAGERSDAALQQATKLGVSIVSEDQLLEFVRYTPKFAVRDGMVFVLKGKFTKVGRGAIEDFIEKNGGKIEGSVRNGTHVLVVGEGAVDEIATARSLGVTVVDQSQFANLAH